MFFRYTLAAPALAAVSLKKPEAEGTVRRYATAALAVFFAVVVRLALNPVFGPDHMPYITLFSVIVFCAVYCGVGTLRRGTRAGGLR